MKSLQSVEFFSFLQRNGVNIGKRQNKIDYFRHRTAYVLLLYLLLLYFVLNLNRFELRMSVDRLSDRRWLSLSVTGSDLCLTNRGWEWFVSDKSKTNRGWKWFVSDKSRIFSKLSSRSTLDWVFQSLTVDRVTEIRETTTSVTANEICAIVVLDQSSQSPKASCKCVTKNRKDPTSPKYYVKYLLRPCAATLVPWEFTSSNRYRLYRNLFIVSISKCSACQPIKLSASSDVIVMAKSQSNQTLVINSRHL